MDHETKLNNSETKKLRHEFRMSIASFVKLCSHNEIQLNSKVYSSFASIYAEGGTLLYNRLGLN